MTENEGNELEELDDIADWLRQQGYPGQADRLQAAVKTLVEILNARNPTS